MSLPAAKGPRRDRVEEQIWRNLLKQFAASGQSVREFSAAGVVDAPATAALLRAIEWAA